MEANIKQANAVFIQRYATAVEWTANNPIIYPGEIGIESDTGKIKVGGTQPAAWRELGYATSDGAQVIDNLTTIYNDYQLLPIGSYNGQQLVAKTNGSLPMGVYRWMHSESTWIFIDTVKENVIYLAKRKQNSSNVICFYDEKSGTFLSTEQRERFSITDIDKVFFGIGALDSFLEAKDNDVYVVYDYLTSLFYLYQYLQSTQQWIPIALLNDQKIYSNELPSVYYSAPANSLWKANMVGETINFVRLGHDTDLAAQIGDISSALTELHEYAQAIIGGTTEDLNDVLTEQEELLVELKTTLSNQDSGWEG